jgi:hypothetical protein
MKGKSMTTDSNQDASGGSNTNPGGEGDKSQDKKSVSYETYSKLLDEAKSVKLKLKEYEEKVHKTQEEKLKAEGDWKGLIELREARIKELEGETDTLGKKYQTLNERIANSQKLSSVISKLGGSLDPKYYGLIDLSDVKVNPETGEIDDMSAAKVAESFRVEYSETIKKGFNPNSMGENRSGSNNGQGTISHAEWLRLPYLEQKKWKYNQIK